MARLDRPSWHLGLMACLLCFAGSRVVADPVTFSSTHMSDSSWDVTKIYQSGDGGTVSGWHVDTGTSAYRECRIHFYAGGPTTIWAFHRCIPFQYDPQAQGAVSSIDYSEYGIALTGDQNTGPAIRQNGVVYGVYGLLVSDTAWTAKALEGLTASDFYPVDGPSSAHPDFSATASPLEVGFVAGASTGGSHGYSFTVDVGIDNWTFTVNPVPEPATLSLMALGLGGLALLKRRRHR